MSERMTMWMVDEAYGDNYICASEARAMRKALEILGDYLRDTKKTDNVDALRELDYVAEGIASLAINRYIDDLVYISEVEVLE